MSPDSKQILLYGLDPTLLTVRHTLLAQQNISSLIAGSATQFDNLVWKETFSLVVLCHTLPLAEIARAQGLATARTPPVPYLSLVSAITSQLPAGRTVNTSNGPQSFLLAVAGQVASVAP